MRDSRGINKKLISKIRRINKTQGLNLWRQKVAYEKVFVDHENKIVLYFTCKHKTETQELRDNLAKRRYALVTVPLKNIFNAEKRAKLIGKLVTIATERITEYPSK